MVKSTIYKGIEFVRLSSLSIQEQEMIHKHFNRNAFIKILIGEEIVHDCIQYKDYALWYGTFVAAAGNVNDLMKDQTEIVKESVRVI